MQPTAHVDDDSTIVAGLRRGDEATFERVVSTYSTPLVRLAEDFVRTRAVAEEVVQETWLAVLEGIDRFEARSSFKTWLFRILVNKAKTRGVREARTVPLSTLVDAGAPAVPPSRCPGEDDRWPGHWAAPPRDLASVPEEKLLAREARETVVAAIAELPVSQRLVVTLRDVADWSAPEVCDALGVTESNQRVLLHRGRARLRTALESYLEESAR
jgi:RNA polymerase sigma-70 factor (ECF subfamily)